MLPQNALAIETAVATGMRIGDVLKMTRRDLRDPNKIYYVAQKTGKAGVKQIDPDLYRRLVKNCFGRWAFPSPYKDGETHRTRQTVWRAVKQAAKKCGVTLNVTPHSARKTYAVTLCRAEGIGAVKRELQHDSEAVTMLYALSDSLANGGKGSIADNEALAELVAVKVVQKLMAVFPQLAVEKRVDRIE